jgi:phospholipase C
MSSLRVTGAAMAVAFGVAVAASMAGLVRREVAERTPAVSPEPGIHKISHVVVITQENRSFDSHFEAFPGADGIPAGVCLPDSRNSGCRKPWADHYDTAPPCTPQAGETAEPPTANRR